MAAQPRVDSHSSDDGDALALSVLHDALGVAAFLATHPLHAAYALFFSRYLLSLLVFFSPLLVSTSLLVIVLVTIAPSVSGGGGGAPEWPGASFLGRTCGIAIDTLCAELRPDGGSGSCSAGLVGQLCSFVLGPADAAAVLRVGKIMGELCDIGGSCFMLEEKGFLMLGAEDYNELSTELSLSSPLEGGNGEKMFFNHEDPDEIKDGIEEKNVVCEDLKEEFRLPNSSPCPSEAYVQEMQDQEKDGFSDGVEEKRLTFDTVPVEIKKCEVVKPLSSVSQRIKQWEAHASGDLKRILDEMEEHNPVDFTTSEKGSFKVVEECVQLETEPCSKKRGEIGSADLGPVQQQEEEAEEQGFKDVKECVKSETKAFSEDCCREMQAEENLSIAQPEQEIAEQSDKHVQPEQEQQDQEHRFVLQLEQDLRLEEEEEEEDYKDVESVVQELQDDQGHDGVQSQDQGLLEPDDNGAREEESAALECEGGGWSFKSTSIARRVHSRNSSEHLVGEGSPARREKEWKRTLACKLYEERMQLRLCRDRAVVECGDNMDMLWEAYESGGNGGGDAKRGRGKAKGARSSSSSSKQEELAEEGEHVATEEGKQEDEEDEGSVRQLCCLQALKFSTKKMSFGGGKPSLAKISKVLRRMTALSRVGSRCGVKE